jgi:hypothetical protein
MQLNKLLVRLHVPRLNHLLLVFQTKFAAFGTLSTSKMAYRVDFLPPS